MSESPPKRRNEIGERRVAKAPTWWREEAKARIVDMYGSQAALARELEIPQSGISQALSERQHTSVYLPLIAEAIELPLPYADLSSERVMRLIAAAEVLDAQKPDVLESYIRHLEELAKALTAE